jgi:hypothetical protein
MIAITHEDETCRTSASEGNSYYTRVEYYTLSTTIREKRKNYIKFY